MALRDGAKEVHTMIDTSMREYHIGVTICRSGATPTKVQPKHSSDPSASWMFDDAVKFVKEESRTASPGVTFAISLEVRAGAEVE